MRLKDEVWRGTSGGASYLPAAALRSWPRAGRSVRSMVIALGVATLSLMLGAGPSLAAFPGKNGELVVQPVGGNGLLMVAPDGGQARRICSDVACGRAVHPAWSADGQELVYATPKGLVRVVYADGTCLNCGVFGDFRTPAFTAAGDILASDRRGVERFGVDGLDFGPVLAGAASGAVSAVTGRLAFVGRSHGRNEVFVTDSSGGHVSQLTRSGAGSPSWAPDGSKLAVVHSGVVELIDLRGRVLKRLARGGAPAFSPDGRWIAYVAGSGQIVLVPVGGGSPRPVGNVHGKAVDWQPVPNQPPSPCVAPAGSTVVVSSADAVLTSRTRGGITAYMTCLRSTDRLRYLGAPSPPDPNASQSLFSYLGGFALAGDYLAYLSYEGEQYHGTVIGQSGEIELTNLLSDSTVAISDVDVPDTFYPWADPNSTIRIVLTAQPLLAWELTAPSGDAQGGVEETISAHDSQGTHLLDSETVTASSGLADLAITGDQVTWTHDGEPRSATLQP